ncbi:hypothetical protein [Pedococcus sp.]|uniref:hypothetical protein n=1 Tax=Pedococcus sp. TaxID=2860345 RepID=UPI002E1171D5|nr:hypothetical protein [Pedococcus sp.]
MISAGTGLVGGVGVLVLGRTGVTLELGYGAGVTGLTLVAVLVGVVRVAIGGGTVGPDAGGVVVAVCAAVVRDGLEAGELGRGDEGAEQAVARASIRTSGATGRYVTP